MMMNWCSRLTTRIENFESQQDAQYPELAKDNTFWRCFSRQPGASIYLRVGGI